MILKVQKIGIEKVKIFLIVLMKVKIFIKYFQNNKFNYIIKRGADVRDGSSSDCFNKRYLEPTEYITVWIENFNALNKNKAQSNFYIKQLVYFREYVPDLYDNK